MDACRALLDELRSLANPANAAGMARFGISGAQVLGVPMPVTRRLARGHRRDHALAECLWASGIHEARILASLIDDPAHVTPEQMDAWAADFDSWDVCDQVCGNLFVRTPFAHEKTVAWCVREETFVKRAGFAMIASTSWKGRPIDADVATYLGLIEREADDDRNYVKKAVSWALRQIGKRDRALNQAAIATAEKLSTRGSRAARWVAGDALRELRSAAVQERMA
jgi:3-methyladenine DNA glycosylase AlkD